MSKTIQASDINAFQNNHAYLEINGNSVYIGDSFGTGDTLTAYAESGYQFKRNFDPVEGGYTGSVWLQKFDPVSGGYTYMYFTVGTSDKTDATLNVNNDPAGFAFHVETEVQPEPVYSFQITQNMLDELSASNASLEINGSPATAGQTVQQGDVLTAIADTGYEFFPVTNQSYNTSIYFETFDPVEGGRHYYEFTLNDPPTTATLNYQGNFPSDTASIELVVTTESIGQPTIAVNNVYRVNQGIIDQVNANRYFAGFLGEQIDYGVYILSILQLPTAIDESLIIGNNQIKLGNHTLPVSADELKEDVLEYDMGTISVPAPNGNALDFTHTECNVHLPFATTASIAPVYVIGQDVSIVYQISVYSGNAKINIHSSYLGGGVCHSQTSSLGIAIPYINIISTDAELYNDSLDIGGDNDLMKPFVEVLRNDAILANGEFSTPVLDEGLLSGQSGYVEIENVALEFNALESEKEGIRAALNEGVFINV